MEEYFLRFRPRMEPFPVVLSPPLTGFHEHGEGMEKMSFGSNFL
jgi:hypothetical protein